MRSIHHPRQLPYLPVRASLRNARWQAIRALAPLIHSPAPLAAPLPAAAASSGHAPSPLGWWTFAPSSPPPSVAWLPLASTIRRSSSAAKSKSMTSRDMI